MKEKKYPNLVEQIYYQLLYQGYPTNKKFIFNYLKNKGLLNKNGQPTKYAIESGAVEKVTSPIGKYKAKHPVFANFENNEFNVNDSRQVIIKPKALRKHFRNAKALSKQAETPLKQIKDRNS